MINLRKIVRCLVNQAYGFRLALWELLQTAQFQQLINVRSESGAKEKGSMQQGKIEADLQLYIMCIVHAGNNKYHM